MSGEIENTLLLMQQFSLVFNLLGERCNFLGKAITLLVQRRQRRIFPSPLIPIHRGLFGPACNRFADIRQLAEQMMLLVKKLATRFQCRFTLAA